MTVNNTQPNNRRVSKASSRNSQSCDLNTPKRRGRPTAAEARCKKQDFDDF